VSPLSENLHNQLQSDKNDKSSTSDSTGRLAAENNNKSSSETWYGELFHSTAYALVQKPYDGIRQVENHVSKAAFNTSFLPTHEFVAPVNERHDGSAIAIAQTVGSVAGTLPYFLAAEIAVRKSLPSEFMARTIPLMAENSGKRVLSSAVAGGLVEGILNPSTDDENWLSTRAKRASIAFTTFAVAGAATEGLINNSFSRKLFESTPAEIMGSTALKNGLVRAHNFTAGIAGGATGGAIGVEASSLALDGKFASASDVVSGSLKAAALMGTLSSLRGTAQIGRSLNSSAPSESSMTTKLSAAEISVPRPLNELPPVGKIQPPTLADAVPPPVPEFGKAFSGKIKAVSDELTVTTDPKQIGKIEVQARKFLDASDFDRSAKAYSVAIDSWETIKTLAGRVDETHLRQLYRELANARLKGDKP